MQKTWVGYLGVGILGILIGQLLPGGQGNDSSQERGPGAPSDRSRSSSPSSRPEITQASTAAERWGREASKAKPHQFTDLVYRALEIPDPFERQMAILEILKYADASNGPELIEGFVKVSWATGRTHDGEWNAALAEVGRKGGAPILDRWKAEGCDGASAKLWTTLYGMATGDPQGAINWLNGSGNDDMVEKNRLYGAVIAGATQTNPDEGIRILETLTPELKRNCLGEFTKNLIQNGGLDRGVDWMLEVRRTSASTDPKFVEAAENQIYNKITGSVLEKGGAAEMAGHLSKINAAGAISTPRLINSVSRIPIKRRFDLFEQLAQSPSMANNEAVNQALDVTVSQASHNNPEAVNQWLESHPASPLTGRIRELLDRPKTE